MSDLTESQKTSRALKTLSYLFSSSAYKGLENEAALQEAVLASVAKKTTPEAVDQAVWWSSYQYLKANHPERAKMVESADKRREKTVPSKTEPIPSATARDTPPGQKRMAQVRPTRIPAPASAKRDNRTDLGPLDIDGEMKRAGLEMDKAESLLSRAKDANPGTALTLAVDNLIAIRDASSAYSSALRSYRDGVDKQVPRPELARRAEAVRNAQSEFNSWRPLLAECKKTIDDAGATRKRDDERPLLARR